MVSFFNQQRIDFQNERIRKSDINVTDFIDGNPKNISWTVNLKKYVERNQEIVLKKNL